MYGVDPQTVPCEPSSEEIAEARLASVDRNRTYGPTTADEVAEFLDWDERRAETSEPPLLSPIPRRPSTCVPIPNRWTT